MKKTFKRAGVAVLSMAMLLSMGAVGAMTASALDTTTNQYIKLPDGPASTTYAVYKLANVTVDGGAYSYSVNSKDLEDSKGFETKLTASNGKLSYNSTEITNTMGSAAAQAMAKDLATVVNDETPVSGMASLALEAEIQLTPGYYLIVNSGTATPILLTVRSDDAHTTSATALELEDKSNGVTIDKSIEKINNVDKDHGADIKSDKNNANAKVGDVVTYSLTTKTPKYDTAVTKLAYPFTITDTPESGKLKIDPTSVKVSLNGTEYTSTKADVVTITATTTGITVVVDDDYILAKTGDNFINQDKDVIVTFDATIQAAADTGKNSNTNTVELSYDNDFTTDGKTGSEGTDEDTVAVFVPEFDLTKTYDGSQSSEYVATFQLYEYDSLATDKKGSTVGSTVTTTTENNVLTFKNIMAGKKYVLSEVSTTGEYKLAPDVIFEVSDDTTTPYAGSFHYGTLTTAGVTDDNDAYDASAGKGATTVNNISGQKLPGTGGMGTTLFTIGGAAIVLLAGAMFVVYMRRRKNEE